MGDEKWLEILRDAGWEMRECLKWSIDLLEMYDEHLIKLGKDHDRIHSPQHKKALSRARKILEVVSSGAALEAFHKSRMKGLHQEIRQLEDRIRKLKYGGS